MDPPVAQSIVPVYPLPSMGYFRSTQLLSQLHYNTQRNPDKDTDPGLISEGPNPTVLLPDAYKFFKLLTCSAEPRTEVGGSTTQHGAAQLTARAPQ